jgi:glycine/D-amino acid oxidase-like deaminating enzyme
VTTDGKLAPSVVVNAVGAWGAEVGALMGSRGPNLEARRTIFVSPTHVPTTDMLFTCDLAGQWCFKAEGDAGPMLARGRLCPPCRVTPDRTSSRPLAPWKRPTM